MPNRLQGKKSHHHGSGHHEGMGNGKATALLAREGARRAA
jgi:hypothetical protein